jgi:hypothetical protein
MPRILTFSISTDPIGMSAAKGQSCEKLQAAKQV